jgi:hypothetical protein
MGWMENLDRTLNRAQEDIFHFIDDPIGAVADGIKGGIKAVVYASIYEIGALFGLKGLFGIHKMSAEEYDKMMNKNMPANTNNNTRKEPNTKEWYAEELRKNNEKMKRYEKFVDEILENREKTRNEKTVAPTQPQFSQEKANAPLPEIPKPAPLYSQEKANAPLPEIPKPVPLYSQEKANAPLPEIPKPAPLYSQEKANAPLPEIPKPAPLYSQEKANAPLPEIPQAQGRERENRPLPPVPESKPLPPVPQSLGKDGKPLPEIPGRQPMSSKDLDAEVKKTDNNLLSLPSWRNKDKVPLNKDGKPMLLSERLNLPGRNNYVSKKVAPSEPKLDEPAKEKAPAPMLPKKKK